MHAVHQVRLLDWRELTKLLNDELARFDIAAVNLACAVGLPGAEQIDLADCLDTLDLWAERVRAETDRLAYLFQRRPDEYDNSWAYFRVLAMVTVLQRDLGLHGDPASLAQEHFPNSEDTFIYGVCRNKTGTCAAMPVAYAAVGRRLGYPIKLVGAQQHLFARWDETGGERFNIECTCRGLACYPDEHYLTWHSNATPEQIQLGGYLKSMTPRQELKHFLITRGYCWEDNGRHCEAAETFAWVASMEPSNPMSLGTLHNLLVRWHRRLGDEYGTRIPDLGIDVPTDLFPALPRRQVGKMLYLDAVERFFQDPLEDLSSWDPCKRCVSGLVPDQWDSARLSHACDVILAAMPI